MNRRLFWKLCFTFATGVVAMFYFINQLWLYAEDTMSHLDKHHQDEIKQWGETAEHYYKQDNMPQLKRWLHALQTQENTQAAIVYFNASHIAGDNLNQKDYTGFNFGRSIEWPVHLHLTRKPMMEIPFKDSANSLILILPDRMRPGNNWRSMQISLQILMPMLLLAALSILVYQHIMQPLKQLKKVTQAFSQGDFSARAQPLLNNRNDELSDLAKTFDQMAERISQQFTQQRQLIADLSHELRTPLTRLDIAVESLQQTPLNSENLKRVARESRHIRRLTENTLTLAWLENEQPKIPREPLNLVDLLDVLIEDARFEYPHHRIETQLPSNAILNKSNHRALGQAIENIVRNALRFTPQGKTVTISLSCDYHFYKIEVKDQGPGVPEALLDTIFQPFFRVDNSRPSHGDSFGLGLALAKRQIQSIGADIYAHNNADRGLSMTIRLPKS